MGNQKIRNSILMEPRPPAAGTVTPEMLEDEAYLRQKAKDEAQFEQKKVAAITKDQIGYILNSGYYVTNYAWPLLKDKLGNAVRVTRYYPQIKTAVDIFQNIDEAIRREMKTKSGLLRNIGVRYGALDYSMEPVDLIPQTGIPRRV